VTRQPARRPPKPRIAKRRLVWRFERGAWTPYHRKRWSDGGRTKAREVRLDWKGDPAELDRLYWQCEAGLHERQERPARHSWRAAILAWRRDPAVQGALAASTRAQYRRVMDAILEKNGAKDMRMTTRQAVRAAIGKLSDTPRKAARYAQVISLLWNYAAQELDWPLGPNPARGLAKYRPAKPYEPWPAWMVNALDTAPPTLRTASRLILGTGQRPNAAITMRWDQFDGEFMRVTDEKGDVVLEVFCPEGLRTYLAEVPRQGTHVLPRNLSQPLGYSAIEKMFRAWRTSLGERAAPYSLHGLRKLAIVELAEAGASDAEIQAVTGQSAEMVAYYRAKADRKKLSRAAQERRR